ncbi:MAG: acetyl-CoA decarbonylase/synthase complex subunit gamma [Candidatus Omnitrophota bacterium]|nr:acetyl-CoA decarbonylase/synthase complex subunit gamma [Candidatus Omnitrophota bacterium]
MALSGLDIYKHLPKTNCRECGFPTCLAFAMSLAKRQTVLEKCPYITTEAKNVLDSASQPPIRLVTVGDGEDKLEIGNETVMFRHEEKFFHPTGIGFLVEDNEPEATITEKIKTINGLEFERVGQLLKVNLIAVKQTGSGQNFVSLVKKVSEQTKLGLVLISSDNEALKAAANSINKKRPLIYCANKSNFEAVAGIAKEAQVPLVVQADNLEELSQLTVKVNQQGGCDEILEVKGKSLTTDIWNLTQIRKLALKKNQRALGFPTMVIIDEKDPYQEISKAAIFICKYASIVILKSIEAWKVLPLLTLRQNIYTDPQRPLQVEAKINPIGNVSDKSPVLITTNFSLTYYTVLSEVESSKVPSYIISVDTEGMSVLTAWAAEKFTPDKIVESINKNNLKEKVSHNQLIIPGYVAVMSGDLEDKSGCKILVGPKEAAGIPSFLKNL